jgi:SAM-dependent methyltransferase
MALDDVEVVTIPHALLYVPSAAEEERLSVFLAGCMLPPALEQAIEAYIEKKTGKALADPVMLERLRHAIVAQKADYWRAPGRRRLRYTKGYAVLGYLAYHFPVYFMQTEHLLAMLAQDGLLKQSMTILDVGTGPGVVPLAIADFWSRLDTARATVLSVERSEEQIEAFMFLRDQCTKKGAPARIKPPVKGDITGIESVQNPKQVDLLIFSNVLNELTTASPEERADLVMKYAERLAPDGTILIVEPAEEENSTLMRILTISLEKRGLTIYSPCSFVGGTQCDPTQCWSFVSAPPIRPTRIMNALAACEEPFRYVNTDIKYSYAILQKDSLKRKACRLPAGSMYLRFSKLHLHVGKRVNVTGVKMSGELGNARTHVFKLCDGTAKTSVYGVLPSYHITPSNDQITSAPYASALSLRGVLVRYNKAHDAYNLLISRNTQINRIPK